MTSDIQRWIAIIENAKERSRSMSRPHKSFSQVTQEDVVRAFFDIDDIKGFMQNQWSQMDWGEDETGEPNDPPMPHSSKQLTSKQIAKVIQWYEGEGYSRNAWVYVWNELTPISRLASIPITRRLGRLSDLTQPLGIHWSYGNEPWPDMETYGNHIAFGFVKNSDVDWVCTAARAINSWDTEGEISILPGANVELRKIEFGPGCLIKA